MDNTSDTSDTSSSSSFSDSLMTLPIASTNRKPRGYQIIPRLYKHVATVTKGPMEHVTLMENPFPSAEEMANGIDRAWEGACRQVGLRDQDRIDIPDAAVAYVRSSPYPLCTASHADTSIVTIASCIPFFKTGSLGTDRERTDTELV